LIQPGPVAACQPAIVANINCGGGQLGLFHFGQPDSQQFSRDRDFKGGKTDSNTEPVNTAAPNAGPLEVYQTERWGGCSYTVPVSKTGLYTVRLHFAETKLDPGARKFNVEINGQRVLTDFDIAAEAGKGKALVRDFTSIKPDPQGNIVVALNRGSADEPKICAIQVLR
jgi:hypothetical protein